MKNLIFVTGNQHKADMTAKLLGRQLAHQKVSLDELQTVNLEELAEHKVRQAYEKLQCPVLVDDFGVSFDALQGMPGPFVKFFVEKENGSEMLCRMLDGFDDRAAQTTCVMAFYDGDVLKVFTKTLQGTIAQHPVGENGIHTDMIFAPDGYGGKTRAELDPETYDEVYKLVRPLDELKAFLDEYYGNE